MATGDQHDAPRTDPIRSQRIATCTVLAVGALLLSTHETGQALARGSTTLSPCVTAAKAVAVCDVPVIAPAAPMVADPVQPVGWQPPARCSLAMTTVTYETARWVARTRHGGLYGP